MKLGFTGTREGMDRAQVAQFTKLVEKMRPHEFHFGDCLGADAGAFAIVRAILPTRCLTVAHPPTKEAYRAWCAADVVRDPELYAVRNERIVEACDLLAVAPLEQHEVLRSGTWMTVRMARRYNRIIHMLLRAHD